MGVMNRDQIGSEEWSFFQFRKTIDRTPWFVAALFDFVWPPNGLHILA
jgi:hypothetical protein